VRSPPHGGRLRVEGFEQRRTAHFSLEVLPAEALNQFDARSIVAHPVRVELCLFLRWHDSGAGGENIWEFPSARPSGPGPLRGRGCFGKCTSSGICRRNFPKFREGNGRRKAHGWLNAFSFRGKAIKPESDRIKEIFAQAMEKKSILIQGKLIYD